MPVVAVTAYQMLFDYAQMKAGQAVLIHGAAGNAGAYAVQLAKQAELQVFATAGPADVDYVRSLGAETVVNYKTTKFEDALPPCSAVDSSRLARRHSSAKPHSCGAPIEGFAPVLKRPI